MADVGPIVVPDTDHKVRSALKKLQSSGVSYEVPVPGYERVVAGVVSRPPTAPCRAGSGEFGEYAVECVKVDVVRQWMSGHEDELAWKLLRDPATLSEWGELRGLSFVDGKSSRLSGGEWEQLVGKGVVRPCRKGQVRFVAFGFKVLKSDGVKARLIWSGVAFNALFRRPPPFDLPSIPRLVSCFLKHSGYKLVSADLRSWFVQLPPSEWLSRFFGIRCGDNYGIVRGIPMGWAFAPFIAQQFARAVARRVASVLAKKGARIEFVVWIDNVIGAVPISFPDSEIRAAFDQVADESGCIWKEVEIGQVVEALGIVWDLRDQRWRLTPSWVSKVRSVWSQPVSSLYKWWCVVACAVRALSVWQQPLCTMAPALEWLGVQSARLVAGEVDWESPVRPWTKVQGVLEVVVCRLAENPWIDWSELPVRQAYGVADASLEGRAWALHTPVRMVGGFHGVVLNYGVGIEGGSGGFGGGPTGGVCSLAFG